MQVSVYDQQDEPDGFGFDSLSLQFDAKHTGNMRQVIEKIKLLSTIICNWAGCYPFHIVQ